MKVGEGFAVADKKEKLAIFGTAKEAQFYIDQKRKK